MAVYRYDKNVGKFRRRKLARARWLILIIIIGVGAFVFFRPAHNPASVSGQPVSTKNNPYQEFQTDYFKFKVSKNWSRAEDLGGSRSYVYRNFVNSTPVGILTIALDPESFPLVTAVLPVTVVDGAIKNIGEVSKHCSSYLSGDYNLDPHDATIDGVTFRCWTDGAEHIVAIGQRGGGLGLKLERKNQEVRSYLIAYQSTSFEPDQGAIAEVIQSFEAL